MRLTINGETVDFTLEAERALGEVVASVERWLRDEGFIVNGVRADGEELAAGTRAAWGALPLDGVGELAVQARHSGELRIEHWMRLADWLGSLAAGFEDPAGEGLEELLAASAEALGGLAANPAGSGARALAGRLSASLEGARAAEARLWQDGRRSEVAALARELAAAIGSFAREAVRPAAALAARLDRLAGIPARLSEVPVALATGGDREAMAVVRDLSDSLEAVLSLLPFLPRDRERERLLAELAGVLRDLAAALEARDTVLTGDLAEYEVAPRLQRLVGLLEKIS